MARKRSNMKGLTIKGGHKRPTKSGAGMTAKGVKKYRQQNPGSKLKTAVTEKTLALSQGLLDGRVIVLGLLDK